MNITVFLEGSPGHEKQSMAVIEELEKIFKVDVQTIHVSKTPLHSRLINYFRFLLLSGKPSYEPIVRYGPFVMNTQEEIQQALRDLRGGTFVR